MANPTNGVDIVGIRRQDNGVKNLIEDVPFEIDRERDYFMQLDVVADTLELRAWPEGEERPEEPQVTVTDDRYRNGSVGIAAGSEEEGAHVVYRYVWISDDGPLTGDPLGQFLRGDCNGDGDVNLTDAQCALNWLFAGADTPECVAALNTNGDDKVDIADAVALLNYLFSGGPAPEAPFPDCGPGLLEPDATLGCLNPRQNCVAVP